VPRHFTPEHVAIADWLRFCAIHASALVKALELLAATTGIRHYLLCAIRMGQAAENLRKHGVDFADAIAALEDANRLEEIDTRFEYSESVFKSSEWLAATFYS
jgi:hypothetical protein